MENLGVSFSEDDDDGIILGPEGYPDSHGKPSSEVLDGLTKRSE